MPNIACQPNKSQVKNGKKKNRATKDRTKPKKQYRRKNRTHPKK